MNLLRVRQRGQPVEQLAQNKQEGKTATSVRLLLLRLSRTYDSMSNVLGLRDLQDYIQGNTSLPLSESPLWLLGTPYIVAQKPGGGESGHGKLEAIEEAMVEFLADFRSRIWITYRKEFPPIGSTSLTSDVGWGCTLRSGQMMLAEALMRYYVGRGWRKCSEPQQQQQHSVEDVVRYFWDQPDLECRFSIHNICKFGADTGIVPGEWLGPYVVCKTLEAAVNSFDSLQLSVHVICEPGGGAPTLYTSSAAAPSRPWPRLMLVPLTLGVEKMNPVYHEQLKSVLRLPQSVGIVGGRPGSSLYFIGTQDDQLLYLDPHFTRAAPTSTEDLPTFHCDVVRHLHISQMDPSLAIGFLCPNEEEFWELSDALAALEASAGTAALITVRDTEPKQPSGDGDSWADESCASPAAGASAPGLKDGTGQAKEGDDPDNWELI
mmetsp:Transcript_20325/g.56335  ORF Transcript_20325/g.56335 Transcript_20325/m.56335 type:complete len:433 (-) Transcript_20325:180-1478(-)|eukprot:CAMPEP_0117682138 /NCGR_PEP_ID=MMETSP0804-20121206/19452_1 /TAXON_ID=1074897 /ORGANISM="Tetraselmis astigmatica, Strain CCMP880" /LENGTH=432 /DNA_ID=CAMNT_0005492135 /DNA_START=195 /DNA_END=1493 /DNA_ORIENTATION=+